MSDTDLESRRHLAWWEQQPWWWEKQAIIFRSEIYDLICEETEEERQDYDWADNDVD